MTLDRPADASSPLTADGMMLRCAETRAPLPPPGPTDRARRAGLRRPAAGTRAQRLGPAARDGPGRAHPDRLGQRAVTRALPAAVRAARPLSPRAPGRGVVARSAAAVRVLGARGVADPRGAAAAPALADGPRRARGVGRHAARTARSPRADRPRAVGGP